MFVLLRWLFSVQWLCRTCVLLSVIGALAVQQWWLTTTITMIASDQYTRAPRRTTVKRHFAVTSMQKNGVDYCQGARYLQSCLYHAYRRRFVHCQLIDCTPSAFVRRLFCFGSINYTSKHWNVTAWPVNGPAMTWDTVSATFPPATNSLRSVLWTQAVLFKSK